MAKKCIICQIRGAVFCIKGTNNCYCYRCAVEHFGDVDLLVRLEDDAKKLKAYIDERINEDIEAEDYTAIKKSNDDVLIDIKIKKKESDIKKETDVKKENTVKKETKIKKKAVKKLVVNKKSAKLKQTQLKNNSKKSSAKQKKKKTIKKK